MVAEEGNLKFDSMPDIQRTFFSFFLLGCLLFLFSCQPTATEPAVDPEVTEAITAIENGLLPAVLPTGDTLSSYTLAERMVYYHVPGVSIAILKDGKIHWAKGYGVADSLQGTTVDTNTLFQAGSISKPLAALAALHLVEEGKLDLDTDVNTYLTGWKIPDHEWSEEMPVTLRHLLTHTGGLTVHGFPGYTQTDTFPTIEQVLKGEGNTPPIFVDTEPGTNWRYSGGGYTIMEKVVEDVSGMPLEEYTREYVLDPMGMVKSTYEQPLSKKYQPQASAAYNGMGTYVKGGWHNYPEQAAAGLWTTPRDLLRYAMEIQEAFAGESDRVLNQETVTAMLTRHKNNWGLGPALSQDGEPLIFAHGGKNEGFSNTFMAFAQKGGGGLAIMTNADQGIALMREIERAISDHYGWETALPRRVDTIVIPEADRPDYEGEYVYDGEDVQMEGYQVTLTYSGDYLTIYDPQNGQVNEMLSLPEDGFIDRNSGDRVVFSRAEDGIPNRFVFSGAFPFRKVE
jgi:CubicO group peptidase (beta-lactamase class C family)